MGPVRWLIAATLVLAAAPASALGAQQVIHPNHTRDDGWHTRPAALSVAQVLNENCRQPILSACIANNTDFAYGDRIGERYEVGFQNPHGEDVSLVSGKVWILARHPRRGTRSGYALRITGEFGRMVIARLRNVHKNGWVSFNVPVMPISAAKTLTLAGRVTHGTHPLAKNYVAYIELNFVRP
jgi:hypothetical protein